MDTKEMNIRLEQPQDYREVENLTREAFWNVYRPGCTEHYVLNQYRNNPDFIPELDFVMEENGKIIGHVMFSKAEILLDDGNSFPSWTFGPISIHPDYKRKGYGLKLLNYALEKAKEMGIGLIQMEGNMGHQTLSALHDNKSSSCWPDRILRACRIRYFLPFATGRYPSL